MDIPELREKILCPAMIYSKNGKTKLSSKDIINLRLVNRDWYDTVSVVFHTLKLPLYRLSMGMKNSNECVTSKLNEFINRMYTRRSAAYEPTYTLELYTDFFQLKNYQSTQVLFALHGSGLLSLNTYFPDNGTMCYNFINISLPNLTEFKVTCNRNKFRIDNPNPTERADASALQCANFVRAIFEAASNLKQFSIEQYTEVANLPHGIENVIPPSSIESLKYTRIHNTVDLTRTLTEGHFPNLQELDLHPINFTGDNLFQIFNKFRDTLKVLKLSGSKRYDDQYNSNTLRIYLRFPKMAKLRELFITSNLVELEHGELTLASKFPKLVTLELSDQKRAGAWKWIMYGTKYPTVTRFKLRLVDSRGYPKGRIDSGLVEVFRLAFPNLTHLTLRIHGDQVDALRTIFVELTKIEHLTLDIVESMYCKCTMSADDWCSALIGDHNQPFFHRLVNLKTLTIFENLICAYLRNPPLKNYPSISDATFELAFLKMPNLVNLDLPATFRVSEEMATRWRKEKGSLEYRQKWVRQRMP